MKFVIRKAVEKDFSYILKLNQDNVEVLSPMNKDKLLYFIKESVIFDVVTVNNNFAGFIIALNEKVSTYKSENYIYFKKHFKNFIYIDRIVISASYQHMKLGSEFYETVFNYAKINNYDLICAEIDIEPYNEVSLHFHEKMGFNEVGTQSVRNNSVKVSLQIKQIHQSVKNRL